MKSNKQVSFIDLFSGCGGLSLGLLNAGWRGLFAIERCGDAFRTLEHNLVACGDHNAGKPRFAWPGWLDIGPNEIQAFSAAYKQELRALEGKVTLVAGGPPCQGFSFAGRRNESDPRNSLFQHHLDVVSLIRPSLVLMENVQGIDVAFRAEGGAHPGGRPKSYAQKIRDLLVEQGYRVQQHVLKASDYGVPQLRPRYFTLGIRDDLIGATVPCLKREMWGLREEFLRTRDLPIDGPASVRDAISDLTVERNGLVECNDEESPAGFSQINYSGPITAYQRLLHANMNGKPPNSLRLPNHRPATVERFKRVQANCRKGVQLSRADRETYNIRKSVLVPSDGSKPSHTITTIPDDMLHYSEPRVHTVREYARLQSFPDWFEFKGRYTTGGSRRGVECPRYTQVGNAVPPLLAELIGQALWVILRQLVHGQ